MKKTGSRIRKTAGRTKKGTGRKLKTSVNRKTRVRSSSARGKSRKTSANRGGGNAFPPAAFFPYSQKRHDDPDWHDKRLQRLVRRFPEADAVMLEKACAFMKERHGSGADVHAACLHPVRVSCIIMDEWNVTDAATAAAALLHGVIEQTSTTSREVRDAFGEGVGKIVDGMTKWKASETTDAYLTRVERGPESLRLIKCADVLDSLRSWNGKGPEDVSDFAREWREANGRVLPMAKKTSVKAARQIREMLEDEWYLKRANML
jgi:(p)ppGpp synthase/HD superfamily hydrolase